MVNEIAKDTAGSRKDKDAQITAMAQKIREQEAKLSRAHSEAEATVKKHYDADIKALEQSVAFYKSELERESGGMTKKEITAMKDELKVLKKASEQHDKMKKAYDKLVEQHEQSKEQAKSLPVLKQQLTLYRLLTGMTMDIPKSTGATTITVSNDKLQRTIKFTATPHETQIDYKPVAIDIEDGVHYQEYLKERISFEHAEAPLFMKTILQTVHAKKPIANASE